jgi:hypothetical protein
MARNRNCEYDFSGKACDIEYRARRLQELATRAENTLRSLDPAAIDAEAQARALELVAELAQMAERIASSRPEKRTYVKGGKPRPEPKKRGRKTTKAKVQEVQAQAADIDLLDDVVTGSPLVSLDSLLDAAE